MSEDWLNLFFPGAPLQESEFGVTRKGEPVGYDVTSADPSSYSVGDLLQSDTGEYYLLADDGVQPLGDFAGMVYDAVAGRAIQIDGDVRSNQVAADYPAEWPAGLPTPVLGGALCGVLHPGAGEAPAVSLATNPTGLADPTGIGSGRHDVDVEPSAGAYVLSGSDEAAPGGTPYVIDTKGQKYALIGPPSRSTSVTARYHRRWCRARGWSSSRSGCRCPPTARAAFPRTRRRPSRADPGHDPPRCRSVRRSRPRRSRSPPCRVDHARPVQRGRTCDVAAGAGVGAARRRGHEENPAFDRMHVSQAQELATGKARDRIAVIDSGVMAVPDLERESFSAVAGGFADVRSCRATARSWPDSSPARTVSRPTRRSTT